MKYKNITLKKYQIIKHIINKYAESHDNVKPVISYDKNTQILDISGISRPISFSTESIGIIPKGAYEVVGQVIRSKTDDGRVDKDGMNVYNSPQRIFNIAADSRKEVFDFIAENSKSSYCSCCGTNRDRNKLFYIRRVDTSDMMYQVGSSCITEYFDTSYFDLMKEISNVIEHEGKVSDYQFSDYNLIDYLALYCILIKTISNVKTCSRKVAEILDSCDSVAETQWAIEFDSQRAENSSKISTIAKFYIEYPDYVREDNMFAVKTVQSMAEMLKENIDVDPYYSKSNCANVAKMYLSLLSDYASDYRKYVRDLFKYNAYLVETTLSTIWEEQNKTSYKLSFELDNHTYNISIANVKSPALQKIKISVLLDDSGNMVDADKSKSELIDLAMKINQSVAVKSKKADVLDILSKYKDECISRYSNFKPTIVVNCEEPDIRFLDYANEPLVVKIADDIEQSKLKLMTFVNMSYSRRNMNEAYKSFSRKYSGKVLMACTQNRHMNLQFSCDYAEKQFAANWPKTSADKFLTSLRNVTSFVADGGKNIAIHYNTSSSSLKLPVNSIGTISGADYDISLRIQTFIANELGLPAPRPTKVHASKTDEEIVKLRPKKNVTRLFSAAGTSAKNLVSVRKVNVLNDNTSPTLGVSVPNIGKILFTIKDGVSVYQNDMYSGRITLDGHNVSDQKKFDKKTLINAVHALEYLVYLSDDANNLICTREATSTKNGINHTYKYNLILGNCTGNLQFRIVQNTERSILKYGPKFVVEKTVNNDRIICMINLNFNEDCWKDIQQGILKLGDIQQSSSIIHGQKNNNMVSGVMWINNGEPQKLTNEIFTKLTGIVI